MNLNALINPTSRGGYTWSRLFAAMPQQPGQYDGFNYLGLGVLALITAALLFSLRRAVRCPQNTKIWWHRNGPVFAACVFLTLFAVSNKIYWGNTGIELPLPAKLLELCGIFRSSGRMFYLVAACMVVYAVYTLRDRLPGRYAVLVLALFVGVQAFDLSAAAQQKRQKFADPINATVVNNDQTASLGAGHTQLLAAGEVREDRLRLLAILAGKQGLATNLDIAVSGSHPAAEASRADTAARLAAGQYDPTAVYVTTDGTTWENWQAVFAGDDSLNFFVADSCYFMVPAV